jgi:hypothetical protein
MTRLELIGGLITTWCAFRLLGGRATLATRDFARVFVLGAAGSTVVAFGLERLARAETSYPRVSAVYAAPIEELAKALPLLVILALFSNWRRLTISDWTLLGLAGATGFTFVQWALELAIPEHDPGAPLPWHWYLLGSRDSDTYGGAIFIGAATTAFVGLLVGLGVRFSRRRSGGAVLALIALGVVAVENGAYRYAVGPLESGYNAPFSEPGGWVGSLHAAFFHGRLELALLIGGLFLASWIEGRWTLFAGPDPRRVLLPDEPTVPFVTAEWLVAATHAKRGWAAFARANRYFRRRREYGLVLAQLAREPESEELRRDAVRLREHLVLDRRDLELPSAHGFLPPRELRLQLVGGWARVHALQLAAVAAALALFLFSPPTGNGLEAIAFSGAVAVMLAIAALAIVLPSAWSLVGRGGDGRELGLLVAATAVGLGVFALVAASWPIAKLMPDYDLEIYAFGPVQRWILGTGYPDYGGNPHTVFAVAAFVAACACSRYVPEPAAARAPAPEAPVGVVGGGA